MLPYSQLTLIEHREWERQFNKRAARGEFVPRSEARGLRLLPTGWSLRLRELGRRLVARAPRAAGELSVR
jgi:hypothetical protein